MDGNHIGFSNSKQRISDAELNDKVPLELTSPQASVIHTST
jgi:hypothetical protein